MAHNNANDTIESLMTTMQVASAAVGTTTERRKLQKVTAAQTRPAEDPAPGDEDRPAKKACACGKGTPVFWCKKVTCVTCKAANKCC